MSPISPEEQGAIQEKILDAMRKAFLGTNTFATIAPGAFLLPRERPPTRLRPSDMPSGPLRLRVELRPRPDREEPVGRIETGAAWASTFAWFLGMFPSWFVPDREYSVPYQIVVETSRDGAFLGSPVPLELPDDRLNFTERASAGYYLLQLVVPPALIAGSDAVVSESLKNRFERDAPRAVADFLKRGFVAELLRAGETQVVLLPADDGGRFSVVVLAREEVVRMAVGGSEIRHERSLLVRDADRLEILHGVRDYVRAARSGPVLPIMEEIDQVYRYIYLSSLRFGRSPRFRSK